VPIDKGNQERKLQTRREPTWPDCKVIHDTNLKPYDYQNAPAREPEINEMGC
jgi:hypothetical protein